MFIEVDISAFGASDLQLRVEGPCSVCQIETLLHDKLMLCAEQFYLVKNGRILQQGSEIESGRVSVLLRLLGGKGGFGSMLRAIGAQIEKTTNREACRDLSGRRLRDIAEEQRLKKLLSERGRREAEAKERKQKKLERLAAEPTLNALCDPTYESERADLTEKLQDSIEQGLKVAGTSKRKPEKEVQVPVKRKKKKILLHSDEESSDDDCIAPESDLVKKCDLGKSS